MSFSEFIHAGFSCVGLALWCALRIWSSLARSLSKSPVDSTIRVTCVGLRSESLPSSPSALPIGPIRVIART